MLDLGIDLDVWPWIWLGTAVVFALVELIFVGGSFIILPFAVSAFVAAILGFYDVADRDPVGGVRRRWRGAVRRHVPVGAARHAHDPNPRRASAPIGWSG